MSVARDGSLGVADQLGEASLAVDQRQVAQVAAVMLNQGRKANSTAALAPQRMEVQHPVIAGDHVLAVDQERLRLDAAGSVNDGREAVDPIMAVAGKATDA